jgi:hypothetical protein
MTAGPASLFQLLPDRFRLTESVAFASADWYAARASAARDSSRLRYRHQLVDVRVFRILLQRFL